MRNFVLKFSNFSYHGNRGWSKRNFTCTIKLVDPENPVWCKNRGHISYTCRVIPNFLFKSVVKRSSPNLACVITSWIPSTKKNLGSIRYGFLLPIWVKYTPNVRYAMLRYATHVYYFFWFFQSPRAEMPAWILTLNTSNDAVLRKDDPFDSYKSEFSYLTEFF